VVELKARNYHRAKQILNTDFINVKMSLVERREMNCIILITMRSMMQ